MRPSDISVLDYKFYVRVPDVSTFQLVQGFDDRRCVFCGESAPNSLYYPSRELNSFAPPGMPRQRVRTCQNHYNNLKYLMKKHRGIPKSFEEWFKDLEASKLVSTVKNSFIIPGWAMNAEGTHVFFGFSSVELEDYKLFERWVRENAILFRPIDERLDEFSMFKNDWHEMNQISIRTFESYLQGS